MTFIAILLIALILGLLFFGKSANERFKTFPSMSTALKWTLVIVLIILSIVIGYSFANFLSAYLLFWFWFFLFLLGITLLIGIVDLINKTRYFKVPAYLIFLIMVTIITVIFIKEN